VTPGEVEDVCFGHPWILRGQNGGYGAYARTVAGQYLVVFLYPRASGIYSMATAREMTLAERRRYERAHRD